MKKLYLGKNQDNERIELDFEQENINFILLVGHTGSGKSIFHYHLYKELTSKYSPEEIGLVFLDMTRVDFYNWSSKYLIKPVIHDRIEAIATLDEIADLKTDKKIFIHIEECDMVCEDREGVENAFKKIKGQKNKYIIYSTSRIDKEYFSDWMRNFIDLKVVFKVFFEDDSKFLLGNNVANHFQNIGERILVYNGQQIFCQSFSNEEARLLNEFKL